jgi:hypothetical protein
MFRTLTSAFLILSLVVSTVTPTLTFAAGKDKAGESSARGPKKQLSTIVFAGLAGAILGLSTLSFYGRPQDKLNNIAVGAAIGIIGGAIFSTFKAATEPRDFYNLKQPAGSELWALEEKSHSRETASGSAPNLGFKFSF